MAKHNKGRKLNGILVLDKAKGMSSNKALQSVKRLLDAAKAGHTGSLDPMATGVLPLCFGEATKVSQFLLDADKRYLASVKLGVSTTTGDAEGEVTAETAVPAITRATLEHCLESFRGDIEQTPSIYSALKQDGVPLYKLARQGKTIREKRRTVCIYSLDLLEMALPEFVIDVSCSKGTYIRTLAEDIGRALGCGAHLTALRRSKAGPFTLEDAITVDALNTLAADRGVDAINELLIAQDRAIDWMPALELDPEQSQRLQQGQTVVLDTSSVQPLLRIYCADNFIGIAAMEIPGELKAVRIMQYQEAGLPLL